MGADGLGDYGSFGTIAQRSAATQVGIFRRILRLQILNLLSENQQRGRIGYAIRVLDALNKHLEDFQVFMKAVERARGQQAGQVDLQKEVQKAKTRWLTDMTKKPSLLESIRRRPSEKAIQAETNLLAAQANLINYVREDCLHNAVKAAVTTMRNYCIETQRELERWVMILLEGDRALDVNGLLSTIQSDLDRIVTNIREDQRSEQIERLVQVAGRESQVSDSDRDWALEGIHWDAVDRGSGLALSLNLAREVSLAALYRQWVMDSHLQPDGKSKTRTLATLGRVFEQRFGQVDHVTTVLQWCENHETYHDAQGIG